MKFRLVKYSELSKESFEQSPTWAQYYEASDIETLIGLGFDREDVTSNLERVGWSDEYWFPVPDGTEFGSFCFEYRKAIFTTLGGKSLEGYVVNSGHAIVIFGSNREWDININLLDLLDKDIDMIKADIHLKEGDQLLPLKVSIPFKGMEFRFGEQG